MKFLEFSLDGIDYPFLINPMAISKVEQAPPNHCLIYLIGDLQPLKIRGSYTEIQTKIHRALE